MLNLRSKLVSEKNEKSKSHNSISIRDKLLITEVQEMEQYLPCTCSFNFPDPDLLHHFFITIEPEEGFWSGGCFVFHIEIPEDYNIVPPRVTCKTVIWHPNISESGEVCLSLLREKSLDGHGWAPTRKLKDLVWGLNSLFTDLLNFEDPLNVEAAEHYKRNADDFKLKVSEYISKYARR